MFKQSIKEALFSLLRHSILSAGREQKLTGLSDRLKGIVPDIANQYTTFVIDDPYTHTKVRMQHAFQISMALRAIDRVSKSEKTAVSVVDVGDSSGTHIKYLRALRPNLDALSVNLDPVAVEKIRAKGEKAILCRAEELHEHEEFSSDHVDVFLSFETLEHLFDPVSFMKSMADRSTGRLFVLTVPYRSASQVGLHQLRSCDKVDMYAENTHIFELSPGDWKLLFRLSGWRVVDESIYLQYPKYHPLLITRPLWRKLDFEGFYGCVLEPDHTEASLYKNW